MILHLEYLEPDESSLVPAGPLRAGKPVARLRSDAAAALAGMIEAAKRDGVHLGVLSGYRSIVEQAKAFADAEMRHGRGRGIRWVAPPGRSEHATGWAVDLGDLAAPSADDELPFADTPSGLWLSRHAAEFGFEMSFPPRNWQNVGPEPWHFRFVGSPESRAAFHPGAFATVIRALSAAWVFARS